MKGNANHAVSIDLELLYPELYKRVPLITLADNINIQKIKYIFLRHHQRLLDGGNEYECMLS